MSDLRRFVIFPITRRQYSVTVQRVVGSRDRAGISIHLPMIWANYCTSLCLFSQLQNMLHDIISLTGC